MTRENDQQKDNVIDTEIEGVEPLGDFSNKTEPDVSEEDFADFIGNNAVTYFRKFRKFHINDPNRFAVTWNWPAFFFTYIWFVYRKMYAWAGLILIAGFGVETFLPFMIPFWVIALGMSANFFYFRHARRIILELKATQPFANRQEMSEVLNIKGGVNKWILAIAILLLISEYMLYAFAIL